MMASFALYVQNGGMPFAKVLVESKSPGIGDGLTYQAEAVQTGAIVSVPMRNKTVAGIVFGATTHTGDFDVKAIQRAIQTTPLLPEYALRTAEWMAEYYCCSLRQAVSPFLPAQKWADLLPKKSSYIHLLDAEANVRGARQQEVVDYLRDEQWVQIDRLRTDIQTPLTTLRSMEQKGLVVIEDKLIQNPECKKHISFPSLTEPQKNAYQLIKTSTKPSLLFGVTGSGKTEVYAELICDAVRAGKQAILLVPEILLTEHIVTRFQGVLAPERIAIVHSRLTAVERKGIWRQCRANEVDLVIGSRSALFSPLEHLGLVVIDEEHEWTYKNEQTPRYHARDTAEQLCKFAQAKLVLGTATPSIESWQKAKTGQYTLARLQDRYLEQAMPDVSVVDLSEVYFHDSYPVSPTLETMIRETLEAGEQSVLFLNRRGHSSALLCTDCKKRIVSPETQLPLTVHTRPDGWQELMDHITNVHVPMPTHCPNCQSTNLINIGAGTQRLEQVLRQKFPSAKVLRADSDTLQHPEQMRDLLQKMRSGEADILLGTQTVAKGLDLPKVTLAAVLVADVGMSLPHFRAGERIFQMLTQLTGRSGRSTAGRVVIQTFRPESPEVVLAAQHKTEDYLERELAMRTALHYPPVSKMIRLLFRGPEVAKNAKKVQYQLKDYAEGYTVHCAPTLFSGGKVWQVLIRGVDPKSVLQHLDTSGFVVDVDPIECI